LLDKRNLKTPSGTRLVIPKSKKVMALLIAHEWQIQDEVLKQHALPMVRCATCLHPVDESGRTRCRNGC